MALFTSTLPIYPRGGHCARFSRSNSEAYKSKKEAKKNLLSVGSIDAAQFLEIVFSHLKKKLQFLKKLMRNFEKKKTWLTTNKANRESNARGGRLQGENISHLRRAGSLSISSNVPTHAPPSPFTYSGNEVFVVMGARSMYNANDLSCSNDAFFSRR